MTNTGRAEKGKQMPSEQVSRTNDERETRRLIAWELHQQGWSQTRIAEALGVTQGAVSQWLKRSRDGGVEALRHHPAPGRKPFLSDEQFAQIPALIACGPAVFDLGDAPWTIRKVSALLRMVFGVTYHPTHVRRLLQKHCPDWREGDQKLAP